MIILPLEKICLFEGNELRIDVARRSAKLQDVDEPSRHIIALELSRAQGTQVYLGFKEGTPVGSIGSEGNPTRNAIT